MLPAVRARALASLRPPPRLPLSAWIEANVVLPQGTTAIPGPMRLWPYQRAIADSIADAAVERVVVACLEPKGKEQSAGGDDAGPRRERYARP